MKLIPHFCDLFQQIKKQRGVFFVLRANYLPHDKTLTPSEAYEFFFNKKDMAYYVEKMGPITSIIIEVRNVRTVALNLKYRVED